MELRKGETFASLLNIHSGDIRVVPTHLVLYKLTIVENTPKTNMKKSK